LEQPLRVLVTGGLGFVGHAVTRGLADAGHDPVVLTSRPDGHSRVADVPVLRADVRDRVALRRVVEQVRPEGVCHLAALTRVRESFEAPLDYYDVNVGGTLNLLASLVGLPPVPVVFASTGAVYGFCEGNISEDQPTQPANPYGASKQAAESVLRYHAATGAVGVVTLRCFNIAGAVDHVGDRDITRIIPKAIAVAAGQAGVLGVNGDGDAVREFTHVADVANAMILGLDAARPGTAATYNIGSGIEVSLLDVVQTIESITGRQLPVEHHPPKPEPAVLVANSDRIRHDLDWHPRRSSLDQIIRDAWSAAVQSTAG
jgi:UDP-glucose 4-epimerase